MRGLDLQEGAGRRGVAGQKNGDIREEVDVARYLQQNWAREEDPIVKTKLALMLPLHNGWAMQPLHCGIAVHASSKWRIVSRSKHVGIAKDRDPNRRLFKLAEIVGLLS